MLIWEPWPLDFDYIQQWQNTTIKDFESTTSNKVTLALVDNKVYMTKMSVGAQTGQNPDLMFPVRSRATMAFDQLLMPLDDILYKELQIPKDDFYSVVLPQWTYNGKLYGFPGQVGIKCYLYRKDYFQEGNVTKFPDTWEEFALRPRRV